MSKTHEKESNHIINYEIDSIYTMISATSLGLRQFVRQMTSEIKACRMNKPEGEWISKLSISFVFKCNYFIAITIASQMYNKAKSRYLPTSDKMRFDAMGFTTP